MAYLLRESFLLTSSLRGTRFRPSKPYWVRVCGVQPANGQGVPTMSSREIAEYTGKDHPNVMRDIRGMLEGLGEVAFRFEGYYVASNGKRNPEFQLPKRECMILVSGYNVRLRAAIVDRWQELEQAERLAGFRQSLKVPGDDQDAN